MVSQRMQGKIGAGTTITPKEVKAFFKKIPEDSIPIIESEVSYAQILMYAELKASEKELLKEKILLHWLFCILKMKARLKMEVK